MNYSIPTPCSPLQTGTQIPCSLPSICGFQGAQQFTWFDISLSSCGNWNLDTWKVLKIATSFSFAQNVVLSLPLPITKLKKSRMPTEFLDSTGPALHLHLLLHSWSPYFWPGGKNLFYEDSGHFPRAGPLPGFGKDQRIRLEVFCFFFMEMEFKLKPYVWFLCAAGQG